MAKQRNIQASGNGVAGCFRWQLLSLLGVAPPQPNWQTKLARSKKSSNQELAVLSPVKTLATFLMASRVSTAFQINGQGHRLVVGIPSGPRAVYRSRVLMNEGGFAKLPGELGPAGNRNESQTTELTSNSLDELGSWSVPELIDKLAAQGSDFNLSERAAAKCLDIVCVDVGDRIKELEDSDSTAEMIPLQLDLKRTYVALQKRGVLSGFGSCADALLPLPRNVQPDDLESLTGLPMSSFEPPRDWNEGTAFLGLAAFLAVKSSLIDFALTPEVVIGGLLTALIAERISSASEVNTRRLKHEAGHMLIAYLLGSPVQACLVNEFALQEDGRFDEADGEAAVVFYSPELARQLEMPEVKPDMEYIDCYTIVLMAGIAAEAMANQNARGGQADIIALIRLLSTMEGGTRNMSQIMNQARWGMTQAFLLLREHESVYNALCFALEGGATVGEAIMVIEGALPKEMPAQTRKNMLAAFESQRLAEKYEMDFGSTESS